VRGTLNRSFLPTLLIFETAPGEKGAEEHYDLSDALGTYGFAFQFFLRGVADAGTLLSHSMLPNEAVALWLNAFVRKADVVKIACIAQSVNVISPVRLALALRVGEQENQNTR
jgi:hypothetical protein